MRELARAELGSSAWGWGQEELKDWPALQLPRLRTRAMELAHPNIHPFYDLQEHVRGWSFRPNVAGSPSYRATQISEELLWGPSINSIAEARGLQGKICVQKGLCETHCVTLQLPWWDFFSFFLLLNFIAFYIVGGVAKAKVDTKGWGNEGDGDAWHEKPKGQIKRKSENKR